MDEPGFRLQNLQYFRVEGLQCRTRSPYVRVWLIVAARLAKLRGARGARKRLPVRIEDMERVNVF